MKCDDIRDRLDEYAVGALDAEERDVVERHLAECSVCREEAAALLETAHSLPEALAAVSPHRLPPTLKTELLAAIRESPADSSARPADRARDEPRSERRRPFGLRPRTLAAIAAAAVILLAFTLLWSVRLSIVLADERALREEYADLVGQQEVVLEVVDSDQTVRRLLLPPEGGGPTRPYGKLFTRADMPYLVAMAARLPQPAAGEAYHLWVEHGGTTELAGTLEINRDGFGLLVRTTDRDGPTYDAAQVTLQQEGSTQPSGDPVLVWERSE